jgi:hypothetical protein
MFIDLKLIHSNHFQLGEIDAMVVGVKQELSKTRQKQERTMSHLDWYTQKHSRWNVPIKLVHLEAAKLQCSQHTKTNGIKPDESRNF